MDKINALKQAYLGLSEKYWGEKFYTITHFWELFYPTTEKLRQKSGPLHCTNLNRILIEDLLKTGIFSKNDIKKKWTLLWFVSPHQYLQIKTEVGWTSVDLWSKKFGIEFGDHAHGFHV